MYTSVDRATAASHTAIVMTIIMSVPMMIGFTIWVTIIDSRKNSVITSIHKRVRKMKSPTINSCIKSMNKKKNTIEFDIDCFQVIKNA